MPSESAAMDFILRQCAAPSHPAQGGASQGLERLAGHCSWLNRVAYDQTSPLQGTVESLLMCHAVNLVPLLQPSASTQTLAMGVLRTFTSARASSADWGAFETGQGVLGGGCCIHRHGWRP